MDWSSAFKCWAEASWIWEFHWNIIITLDLRADREWTKCVSVCVSQYEAAFFYKIGRKNYRENLRLPEVPIKTWDTLFWFVNVTLYVYVCVYDAHTQLYLMLNANMRAYTLPFYVCM